MAENTSSLRINVNDLLSLQGVEKQRVEFKAAWNADKKHNRGTYWQVVHSICAFANDFYNDNGGYIIIGVEEKENWDNPDDRQIILPPRGVPARILETTQKEIMGACRANIKPDYCPILSPELVEGKHVLVVWATASDNSPHQCRESNQGPENHYYVRKATETKKASPDEIKHLIEQHSKIPFDDRKASDYGEIIRILVSSDYAVRCGIAVKFKTLICISLPNKRYYCLIPRSTEYSSQFSAIPHIHSME